MISDCFAYSDKNVKINKSPCKALQYMQPGCGTYACPFYRSQAEYAESLEQANQRLESLGYPVKRRKKKGGAKC